jgi:hypothetical protein
VVNVLLPWLVVWHEVKKRGDTMMAKSTVAVEILLVVFNMTFRFLGV